MRRRGREILVVVAVLSLVGAAELSFKWASAPRATVEIVNEGSTPIEDLIMTCGDSRTAVPTISPGATARVFLTSAGTHTLKIRFRQQGNALGVYEMPGFDVGLLVSGRFKQVLRVKTNEVERFQDDDDATTPAGSVARGVLKSMGQDDEDETKPQ